MNLNLRRRLLLIAGLALSPIVLSVFAWQCNPVFIHLKAWGVEYTFEKGVCNLSESGQNKLKTELRHLDIEK